jgi:vesicle-associated membrane protein 7
MCMSDNKFPSKTAFTFLDEMKINFLQTVQPSLIDKAISYSLNSQFSDSMKAKIEYFNKNPDSQDALTQLKMNVIESQKVLLDTHEALTDRGDKINLIVRKASTLRRESTMYYSSVRPLLISYLVKKS